MRDIGIIDGTLESWRLALRHALATMVRLYKPDYNLATYYEAPDATILDLYHRVREEFMVVNALPSQVYALALVELTMEASVQGPTPGESQDSRGRTSLHTRSGAWPNLMATVQRHVPCTSTCWVTALRASTRRQSGPPSTA